VACGAPPNACVIIPKGVFEETRAIATPKRAVPGEAALFFMLYAADFKRWSSQCNSSIRLRRSSYSQRSLSVAPPYVSFSIESISIESICF